MRLTLYRHAEQLAICALPPDAPMPSWANEPGTLRAMIRSRHQMSVVCGINAVPLEVRYEGPFTAFEVQGPLAFATTGVLAAMVAPLAAAKVSVLTLSTFDSDWILVPSLQKSAASTALNRAGHEVVICGKNAQEGL